MFFFRSSRQTYGIPSSHTEVKGLCVWAGGREGLARGCARQHLQPVFHLSDSFQGKSFALLQQEQEMCFHRQGRECHNPHRITPDNGTANYHRFTALLQTSYSTTQPLYHMTALPHNNSTKWPLCHTTVLPHHHSATLPPYYTIALPHYHSTTLQPYYTTALPHYRSATLLLNHTTTPLYYCSTTLPLYYTISPPHYHSTTLPLYCSATLTLYHTSQNM